MTDIDLMPIGAFARLVGLTASALRFYDDAGILRPDHVDAHTGYRFYSDSQVERALQLRQLRDIGMPLTEVSEFFNSSVADSRRLLDDFLKRVSVETALMHQSAARLKESLDVGASVSLCRISGPVFAAAVDQLLSATVVDADFPILNGVRMVIDADAMSLAATDRYRFASRTLVPQHPTSASWAGTVSGNDLRNAAQAIRKSSTVALNASDDVLHVRLADGTLLSCQLMDEAFPDFNNLVNSLPIATHRCTVSKRQLLTALEQQQSDHVGLRLSADGPRLLLQDGVIDLDGSMDGPELTLWFELTTLYPALSSAIGDDLLLDLCGADQPVVLRSADDGDFTTIFMPCRAPTG